MAKITDAKRRAIIADLRRADTTQADVSAKHGVSTRTVKRLAGALRSEPEANPLIDRLDKLASAAGRALELAEQSNDGRELSAAIRAAHQTLQTVAKMRAEIERESEGDSRDAVERIKRVILEELAEYPEVRKRVAERLMAGGDP